MKTKTMLLVFLLILSGNFAVMAQSKHSEKKAHPKKDSSAYSLKPQKSVTHGTVTVEGKKINYKAVAGTIILKNKDNKPTCSMFYVAYFKEGVKKESHRPVTFLYNGGPGSSTMWLQMGAWGPRRVFLKDTQRVLPPYKTVNNDYSLLDASDLVFIDAPGTGFSRVLTKKKGGEGSPNDFYNIYGDGHAFAQFIQNFLSTYNRWNSPKYLFGESYGTFRSAVVSNILETQDNIDLNGVILLSQLFSYANMSDVAQRHPGDGLPYELTLPSAAATAWYHHKVPNEPAKLKPFLKKVEHFAMNQYALALNKGSLLDTTTFNQIAEKIHGFTGLPVSYVKKANLRITGPEYEKKILAKEDKVTGRLDSRYKGPEFNPLRATAMYDPSSATIASNFISEYNTYLRTQLKYGKGMKYRPMNGSVIGQWKISSHPSIFNFANVMPDLAQAMVYNPKLKVMLNGGYFDLATPFFEGWYEMHHLPMPKSLQKNISYHYYFSGHMVYLHVPALKKLHDNVAKFIERTHR